VPVLQDTAAANVWGLYHANKDHTYILDRNGYIAEFWDLIEFKTNKQEVMNTIKGLMAEK